MQEVDFFLVPQTRSAAERVNKIKNCTLPDMSASDFQQYGFDYFDNKEFGVGYGGYRYDGRYADPVSKMIEYYNLAAGSNVLELGCAKGVVLVEFLKQQMNVNGIDYSTYAVENAVSEVKPFIQQGSAEDLPFPADCFDFVYSKEMLPHLSEDQILKTISEAQRVCRNNHVFLEIQVGNNADECDLIYKWDVTHQTVQSEEWWRSLLQDLNFEGQVHFKPLFGN